MGGVASIARPITGLSQDDGCRRICISGAPAASYGDGSGTAFLDQTFQTVPGKGWNTLLRLYSPLEPFFTKQWRPGEFELVQ